ncbi:hypothetical protein BOTBODRAFT_511055 [Botryobasidium botryosum FD-172 SS1]|uniref:Uncharacterized protein n=1 Tax=Botryobasidium botryosum (strain FD-172 SS1) TaxID=930990 RepID=A0A067N3Q6_BOTB1|nr:hypothetical protein BOTBODRAFT_511055 [Botryobasidium botryosum FD-172 SS1]
MSHTSKIITLTHSVHDLVALLLDGINNVHREAEWYGIWSSISQLHLCQFISGAHESSVAVYASPQYVVDVVFKPAEDEGTIEDVGEGEDDEEEDDEEPEDDEEEDEDEEPEEEEGDDEGDKETDPFLDAKVVPVGHAFQVPPPSTLNQQPYVLPPPPVVRSTVPVGPDVSPIITRYSGAAASYTTPDAQPNPTASTDRSHETSLAYDVSTPPPPPPPSTRSWRIPDFTIIAIQRLASGGVAKRMVLVIENKPFPRPRRHARKSDGSQIKLVKPDKRGPFYAVAKQSFQQARYAFANQEHTQSASGIIGAILTIGKIWTYVEYDRAQALEFSSLTQSESKDPTYIPTPSSQATSEDSRHDHWDIPAPALGDYFGKKGWLELLDNEDESWRALEAVARRVRELNGDLWPPAGAA